MHTQPPTLSQAEALKLQEMGLSALRDLMTPQGVLASGRNEVYGCIFGRDSLIIALKLLSGYSYTKDPEVLTMVKTILHGIVALQGTAHVPESGEQPGKCVHEWRPTNHEHLSRATPPWFVYPNGELKNYEGVDETSLLLLAMGRYLRVVGDSNELEFFMPHARAAHTWIREYGDSNGDGFTDFSPRSDWTYGGLHIHSWMDSDDSLFHEDGTVLVWPVATVEVQAYTYAALRTWSMLVHEVDALWGATLALEADTLKERFNQTFLIGDENVLVSALDGAGKPIESVRSSFGHVLFAAVVNGSSYDSILDSGYIEALAKRLLADDLFDTKAGIRTLSTRSRGYNSASYHNGPIWPHDAGMVAEGLAVFGFTDEAEQVRRAIGSALHTLGSPYEYYTHTDGTVRPGYQTLTGHASCKVQGWTAATLYSEMAAYRASTKLK